MDLSNDLISKFVKITNDEGNKKSKESVVYGTTVEYDGEMYVRIDGSDLITPVDTTADIKADERVTVMIKDHTATVTGNISDPSASSSKLGTLGSQISEFDIIIANKVSTELLEAEIAQIEILIAEKADIAELTAIKADIENLNAENANIENLVANKADITDLNATNANITNLDAEIADIRTLVNGNLTSDNIQSLNLTAANTTIQNALIKNAMIDSVAANKIQTGVLDTNSVTIQSEDGSMILTGSVQQFKDENGTVRIQIGKDGGGNFTFILYDETGRGVLIDESGIQSSDAIADGLIVDAKVAEGANIAGSKLDISSVITEINEDNSTTIKSNKIYLDEQGQSLTVAFNALKTQVETIQDVTIDGDLSSIVEQVQSNTTQIEVNKEKIATLVAENAIITKEVSDLEGNIVEVSSEMDTKFTALEQDLSGFKITVDEAYASKKEVTDLENELTTNYSTTSATESIINQKANEITSSISDTYASKQSVTNLEGTLLSDYSTTEDMHSAINQKANEITSSVSETYATKKSVTDIENNLTTNYTTTEDMTTVIEQKIGEINSEVISSMATKESVTDLENNLINNYSTTEDMHSAINQKANQITQSVSENYATKQSVTDLNNNLTTNYSTTSAMNSAIDQKANQITQSVSETYTTKTEFNNLEIGGNNLALQSKDEITNNDYTLTRYKITELLEVGQKYTISMCVTPGNNVEYYWAYTNTGTVPLCQLNLNGTSKQVSSASFTFNGYSNDILQNYVYVYRFPNNGTTSNSTIHWIKIEKGDKATDWSPAPEDVQGQITDLNNNLTTNYSTTSQMNSAIDQKANQITQSVSETYTTKTEFNNLEIGGTNLYLNSNFVTNPQLSALSSGSQYQVAQTVDGGNVKANYGGKVLYVYGTTGDIYAELAQQVILESNTTYTVSFDYYGAGAFSASSGYIYLIASDGDIQFVTLPTGYNNNKKRERKQVTFTTDSTHVKCMLRFGMWVNGEAWIAIDGIKLEKGNKATAWSPAPEDTTGSISSLTTRVQTAESTLSKDGLTTIIGDHYTTTSDVDGIVTAKGYATTSQVQQTKNELTATFKSSGGYNLIKNGRAVMDTSFWKSNGGGISRGTNAAGGYIGTYFTTGLPNGITGTEWIELKNNTDYVYQAMLYSPDIDIPNSSDGPLHMQTNSTQSTGHTQITVLDYDNAVPRNNWTQCYVHFRTAASGRVYFMPFIYLYNITAPIYASEIMLSESTVPLPYSPHPTEIYDGITKIDKNGITVTQSNAKSKTSMSADGFAITRTDNGKDIFRVGSNGKLTLNGDFLCYRDGANQTGPRLESSGAMMYGYNDTGGSNPVFASGLWTDEDMGYFSVGYTRADVTDANGCLWMSPTSNNEGCRLTFSRLVNGDMLTTNLYFERDGAIDFITNLRGLNDTDDNYTYRFDSGMSTKAFRCNNIRTHNIYPRTTGSHNIGSASMRYKDIFADSLSTTNQNLAIGTCQSNGSWQYYGPLLIDTKDGYVFPNQNGGYSLGKSDYRFHIVRLVNQPNVSSDKRMKTDIHYLGTPYDPEVVNGRSKVNMNITTSDMYDFVKDDLKLASYRYKVNIGKDDTSVDYGFIAQDVLYTKVGSEIVQLDDPNNLDSTLSVNQGNYITTIAGALQEEIKIRDKQIAELEDKVIGRLQEEIKMKDAQISDLEIRLAKLENIIEQLIEK